MTFSTDRDLLAHEPAIFTEAALASHLRLTASDAAISGHTLSSASADFAAAAIDAGHIVTIGDQPHEVVARVDPHTLTVSLPRTRAGDDPLPPVLQGSGLTVTVRTFAPQAALVRESLLRLLDIDLDSAGSEHAIDAIVSLSVMAHLETLGTLERIYASAGVMLVGGWRDTLLVKADRYRARFREALSHAAILIDTDGDGHADTTLRPGQTTLLRV